MVDTKLCGTQLRRRKMNRFSRCNTLEGMYSELTRLGEELTRLRDLDHPPMDRIQFVHDVGDALGDEIVKLESNIHVLEEVIV